MAILYSFRRCPYAIRARLALRTAGLVPGRDLELREVSLGAKPPELLEASPKGTVPVLVLPDGGVIDESLPVMRWALARRDPDDWLRSGEGAVVARREIEALIALNDGPFKHHLDRFKYARRYPGVVAAEQRAAALDLLRAWAGRLENGGWLLGERPSLADWALLPFVRQFRLADPAGFDAAQGLEPLHLWLRRFLEGPELVAVMDGAWAPRQPWRSPGWLYHLALADEWRQARAEGVYRRSTRGRSVEEVGFLHASLAHQIGGTFRRFYADAGSVVLLTIDPARLAAAGLTVRLEPAPESGEPFPHVDGPLPLEAVLRAESYGP